MAGFQVGKDLLDQKAGEAVLALRSAFARAETVAAWLADTPVTSEGDPLITEFGYSADEAYLLRSTFQELGDVAENTAPIMVVARKLTGLS